MIITDLRNTSYFEGIEKYRKHLKESEISRPSVLKDFLFLLFFFVAFYLIYVFIYALGS